MSKQTRITLALASAALLAMLFLPLWSISLQAPQYPEGLGMRIWLHTVTGVGTYDLQNINELNHYIGMKRITPESIPELRYMPWAVAALGLFGLTAAALRKRALLVAWAGSFLAAAGAGLFDFWRWMYDYGHNLDPRAAIKIEGMSYTPPLLGTKQLLNITASSWPALGGLLAIAVGVAAVWLVVSELRPRAGAVPATRPERARLQIAARESALAQGGR